MAVDRIKNGRIDIEWVKRSEVRIRHFTPYYWVVKMTASVVCVWGPVPTIFGVDIVALVFGVTDVEVAIR
jgi:hypothetical protein